MAYSALAALIVGLALFASGVPSPLYGIYRERGAPELGDPPSVGRLVRRETASCGSTLRDRKVHLPEGIAALIAMLACDRIGDVTDANYVNDDGLIKTTGWLATKANSEQLEPALDS